MGHLTSLLRLVISPSELSHANQGETHSSQSMNVKEMFQDIRLLLNIYKSQKGKKI